MIPTRLLAGALVLAALGGCALLVEPRTVQDGDAVASCRRFAIGDEANRRGRGQSIPDGPVVLRQEVFLRGVQGSARLECVVDFGSRRITSATVDGVEHVRGSAPI